MTRFDDRLRQLDPPAPAIPGPLAAARERLERATARFLTIPDSALERAWAWTGGGETDVRSGFYLAIQALHRATSVLTGVAAGGGGERRPAAGALAATSAARWELKGLLAGVADTDLDADPGGGEWTLRKTLAHTLASERGYSWFTAWWATERDAVDAGGLPPDSLERDLPDEDVEATGTVTDIRRRLDALVDISNEMYRDATDETLALPARWSGFPVTVGFRVGRPGPHMEEHTVQAEKTLAMLGRQPTEVARLVRLVHRGLGGLESAASMLPRSLEGDAAVAIASASEELEWIATDIAEVARR